MSWQAARAPLPTGTFQISQVIVEIFYYYFEMGKFISYFITTKHDFITTKHNFMLATKIHVGNIKKIVANMNCWQPEFISYCWQQKNISCFII